MRLNILLAIILSPFLLVSQNWHPFPFNQTSYFEHTESKEIQELKVDSIRIDTNNVEHGYFNMEMNHPCYDSVGSLELLDYRKNYHSYTFNDTLFKLKKSNSGDVITLYPNMKLNNSIKIGDNTLKCDSAYYGWFLGKGDSIKHFTLTKKNNDEIEYVLSKHFGFVQYEDWTMNGFKNPVDTVGFDPIKNVVLFPFGPGDLIFRSIYNGITNGASLVYIKDSITHVKRTSKHTIFTYYRKTTTISKGKKLNPVRQGNPGIDTLNLSYSKLNGLQNTPTNNFGFTLVIHPFLYLFLTGLEDHLIFETANYKYIQVDTGNIYYREYEMNNNFLFENLYCKTKPTFIADWSANMTLNTLFDISYVSQSQYSAHTGESRYNIEKIDGYRIAGKEFGITKLPTGVSEVKSQQDKLSVYPNPATNNIRIEGLEVGKPISYKILSMNGVLIREGLITKDAFISIENLPKAMYFIHISNEEKSNITKFVKL